MVATDDDANVDIVVQGDEEEITRMTRELGLKEKGMVYVPGILESAKD
jgi:acylphosphatase